MTTFYIILACLGVYIGLGICMAIFLNETPYQDNGWFWITLLWPLFLWAIIAG